MKKEITKTGNFEKFRKFEMNRNELKNVKGGVWIWTGTEWIWIDPK